jgi:hypothetical protein
MKQKTIIWGLAFGFQGTKLSLLHAKNLNSEIDVLGEVGERPCVRDEPGANTCTRLGATTFIFVFKYSGSCLRYSLRDTTRFQLR